MSYYQIIFKNISNWFTNKHKSNKIKKKIATNINANTFNSATKSQNSMEIKFAKYNQPNIYRRN